MVPMLHSNGQLRTERDGDKEMSESALQQKTAADDDDEPEPTATGERAYTQDTACHGRQHSTAI